MHWVIQNNMFAEKGFARLVEALDRQQVPHTEHRVIPFSHEIDPPVEPLHRQIIAIGTYSMVERAIKDCWSPGAFVGPNFDFPVQQQHWGARLFNAGAHVCRLRDVPEQIEPFFVKPANDSKHFAGYVTDWPDFVQWRDQVIALGTELGLTFTADSLVQTSPVHPIYREYRTWIVDRQVVTASQYKQGSRLLQDRSVPPEVTEFAAQTDALWSPAPAYCLDVFESDDGYFVGEINCINCAGFYEGDMDRLVGALEEWAKKQPGYLPVRFSTPFV